MTDEAVEHQRYINKATNETRSELLGLHSELLGLRADLAMLRIIFVVVAIVFIVNVVHHW